jgi:outer membrane protein TolC
MRRIRILPGPRAVGLVALLVARAAAGREVSFAAARDAAVRLAPEVQVAEGQIPVADADVQIAGALANPSLSLSTARQTARFGTSLGVPLPLFGQRSTAVDAARADAGATRLGVEVTRREARWRATTAWFDLWEAQERARLLELAASDVNRLQQIAGEKFEAGSGSRLDVVRTGADRARARAESEDARAQVAAAGARLAPWIGADPAEALIAAGAPPRPGALPGAPETRAIFESQLAEHPALRRDRAQVTAAEAHVRNERRLRWPVVTPALTVNVGDPTLPGTDVIGGVSFDLPLLSARGGAIARARSQRALAETTTLADQRRLQAELLDAARRAAGASTRLRALRVEVMPAMKEAADMTEDGYRAGRIDLVRVLEAQRALLDNRLAEAEAAAAWGRAIADLENASGADLEPGGAGAR